MPNQSDYHNGTMVNPYFMDDKEKEIYYAGYREGRESFAFEESWKKKHPGKIFGKGIKEEYIQKGYLGPPIEEIKKTYNL